MKKQENIVQAIRVKLESSLQDIEESLIDVSPADFVELRSLEAPHSSVVDVIKATALLLAGVDHCDYASTDVMEIQLTWSMMTKLLTNADFLVHQLGIFPGQVDKKAVPEGNFDKIRNLVALPTFDANGIYEISPQASPLCQWVLDVVAYYDCTCDLKREATSLSMLRMVSVWMNKTKCF